MDSRKKSCLINASWGAWYPKGSQRLRRSLIEHGWAYDMFTWQNEPINELFKPDKPYTIKMAAIEEAVRMGYTHILWMDCSIWCRKDCSYLMDRVNNGGLFFWSGFNLAQTSGDKDLEWAETSRDEAEKLPEIWSCCFGFSMETTEGNKFYSHLLSGYNNGVFDTPREHSGLSEDPRFLHARQDQTAVSWAYHKSGFKSGSHIGNDLLYYSDQKDLSKYTLLMRGM